jgi:hypothetical protein
MECQTASLIYTPNELHNKERKWFKKENGNITMIYNHKTLTDESKYFESKDGESFVLSLSAVNLEDSGGYIVDCGDKYTGWSHLEVYGNLILFLFIYFLFVFCFVLIIRCNQDLLMM